MTRKNTLSTLIVILLVLTHVVGNGLVHAADENKKTFLWKVESDDATVYLLGSIHLASPELYPLDPKIESAFNEADTLGLEISPSSMSSAKIQQQVMQKGMYAGNKSIKDDITAETFELLNNYLAANNLPTAMFHKMKPGLLAINLTTMKIMQMGYSPQLGLDRYFYQKGETSKDIVELETVDEQLALILDIADKDIYLQYTLESLEKTESALREIMHSWKHGDAEQMNDIILKPYHAEPELQPLFNKFFHTRNLKMVGKIKGFLSTAKKYFVIVGAGHLVGDQGIVALLRQEGYKVHQL